MLFASSIKESRASICKSEAKLSAAGKQAPARPVEIGRLAKDAKALAAHARTLEAMTSTMKNVPFRPPVEPMPAASVPSTRPPPNPKSARPASPKKLSMTRAEFKKLSPRNASKFCREGGRIVENASEASTTAKQFSGKTTMLRSEFQKLSPAEASKFCLEGGRIVDAEEGKGAALEGSDPGDTLSQSEFEKLSPDEQSLFKCLGGRVHG